jgi:putative flippase GtrA
MVDSDSAAGRLLRRSGFRFLVAGAVNTALTWGVYALLLHLLPYGWSYTVAYALGIVLAYLLYRCYVFESRGRPYGPVWVALIYLFQYFAGLGLVHLWIRLLGQPAIWAPLFSVLVILPLTYALSRWVFRSATSRRAMPIGTTNS